MTQCPLSRRLGGPQSQSEAFWRKNNSLAFPIAQHSLYELSSLGSWYTCLPNNVTFCDGYKFQNPSPKLSKQPCNSLSLTLTHSSQHLGVKHPCTKPLFEIEAENLLQCLCVNTVMAPHELLGNSTRCSLLVFISTLKHCTDNM
jgi:hypothetical protein